MKTDHLPHIYNAQLCPVCGYHLGFKPWEGSVSSQDICSGCGIHFGYDDCCGGQGLEARLAVYLRWRSTWAGSGYQWWSKEPCPDHWDPLGQVGRLDQWPAPAQESNQSILREVGADVPDARQDGSLMNQSQPMTLIYVALLDEGVDVWRPVEAVHEGGDRYRIISPDPDPQYERWEFSSGDLVRCRPRTFQDGQTALEAYSRAIGIA